VPADGVALIRRVASKLRAGGEVAQRLRAALEDHGSFKPAQTGDEVLAFFRSSPLTGETISFERAGSPERPIEPGADDG
jgi:hypothetical protein